MHEGKEYLISASQVCYRRVRVTRPGLTCDQEKIRKLPGNMRSLGLTVKIRLLLLSCLFIFYTLGIIIIIIVITIISDYWDQVASIGYLSIPKFLMIFIQLTHSISLQIITPGLQLKNYCIICNSLLWQMGSFLPHFVHQCTYAINVWWKEGMP